MSCWILRAMSSFLLPWRCSEILTCGRHFRCTFAPKASLSTVVPCFEPHLMTEKVRRSSARGGVLWTTLTIFVKRRIIRPRFRYVVGNSSSFELLRSLAKPRRFIVLVEWEYYARIKIFRDRFLARYLCYYRTPLIHNSIPSNTLFLRLRVLSSTWSLKPKAHQ